MSDWYCDGVRIDAIPIDDRAVHYGDGLFETIAIRAGEPRLWSLHIKRLDSACKRLGIDPPAENSLYDGIIAALQETYLDPAYALAKLIVTAGSGPRGYKRPEPCPGRVLTSVMAAQRCPRENYEYGVATVRCDTTLAAQPALAGIKTLNRLEQVLARNEWQDSDVFEGLMCDADGHLICGTMSNVFVVHDQSVSTAALDRCGVEGVMRRHVLDTFRSDGGVITETNIDWDDAMSADEIFLTNSQFGVMPIQRCGAQHWPVGPVTGKVMKLIEQNGIEESGT